MVYIGGGQLDDRAAGVPVSFLYLRKMGIRDKSLKSSATRCMLATAGTAVLHFVLCIA